MLNRSMFLNCFRYPKYSQNHPQNHPKIIKNLMKKEAWFSTPFFKKILLIFLKFESARPLISSAGAVNSKGHASKMPYLASSKNVLKTP